MRRRAPDRIEYTNATTAISAAARSTWNATSPNSTTRAPSLCPA